MTDVLMGEECHDDKQTPGISMSSQASELERHWYPSLPDPALEAVVAAIRSRPLDDEFSEQRTIDSDLERLLADGASVEAKYGDGWQGEIITPQGTLSDVLLVTIHGGGYVAGSRGTHRLRFGRMGAAAACRVLNLDYRLAPEYGFPAAVNDCIAAARWASTCGPFMLAGDSAGGALALAVAISLQEARESLPIGIVTISPWVDLTCSFPSHITRRDRDPYASGPDARECATAYLSGASPTNPLASPIYAEYAGLPPILVQVGTEDMLFDDALRMAEKAAAAGVAVRFEEWDGMFHRWHGYTGTLRGADEAIDAIGRFVRGRVAQERGA